MEDLKRIIREVPDYPKKGILFYDITTLLADAKSFQRAIDLLAHPFCDQKIDRVLGIDARGFIIASAVAYKLCTGLSLVRKKGKLPYKTYKAEYELEYGNDSVEMHVDAVAPGQRVLIADDLLATGGTAHAAIDLVQRSGGHIVACAFVIELTALQGRKKVGSHPVHSLLQY
ncbi:MAG: adenine phosphoribosyltransferase [Deltaproteobacteria bacterium]|nr:adenine phosphoribosyltransferase [Deltaproteobacteria bacterium]